MSRDSRALCGRGSARGAVCPGSIPHAGRVQQAELHPPLTCPKGRWEAEKLHVPLANIMMQQENPSFLLFCQL